MILVLDKDSVLYLYSSEDEACRDIEAVDVENQEYEFCSDSGLRLKAEITTPVTMFHAGTFKLVPGEADTSLPMAFIGRAREIGKSVQGVSSLAELRAVLTSSRPT